MKLSSLLAQYLLTHKELKMPGFGVFYAEASADPENTTVRFERKQVERFDDAVIDFVAAETGKMKVLAVSDLTSQLEDAQQFLNTGKPYFFKGIGTLLKKADGTYEFVSNTQTEPVKKKDVPFTEKNTIPQSYIDEPQETGSSSKKTAIILFTVLVVIAIAATIWFYSKSNPAPEPVAEKTDSNAPAPQKDSSTTTPATTAASGTITYVLETAKEARANKRYNQLKKLSWPVELEKIDSLQYSIVMHLNTPPADTARVRDSLSVISGKKVRIR